MWNWTLFYMSGDSKTPFAVIPNVQMRRLKLGEVRYGTQASAGAGISTQVCGTPELWLESLQLNYSKQV